MLLTLATVALAAAASAAATATDTTFQVPKGSRLNVVNFSGAIAVQPWSRDQVRIRAMHPDHVRVVIGSEGTSYLVESVAQAGAVRRAPRPRVRVDAPAAPDAPDAPDAVRAPKAPKGPFFPDVEYQITAPPWMSLDLEGVFSDVTVDEWKSDVLAKTVNGLVRVRGGQGLVRLSSVAGPVVVSGARGRLQLSSLNDTVQVMDVVGDLSVESVSGDLLLQRIRSKTIEAQTVRGDVRFTGWIEDGGRYGFATHTGDLDIALPEDPNVAVSVATFRGGFESSFPVAIRDRRGRKFSFTLGSGAATVDLETFEGMIRLSRDRARAPRDR
jgi:hypothetical protein